MQYDLIDRTLKHEEIKKWLDEWISSKNIFHEYFFLQNSLLSEKWKKVISSNGKYVE